MARGFAYRAPKPLAELAIRVIANGHGVKFKAMIDQSIAKSFCDFALEAFDFFILKFYHFTALNIDQVIVMFLPGLLIARPAMSEVMAFKHMRFLEQAHGPIDRGQTDSRIDSSGAPIHGIGVGMVLGIRKHLRDDAALFGHFEPLFEAQTFDAGKLSVHLPYGYKSRAPHGFLRPYSIGDGFSLNNSGRHQTCVLDPRARPYHFGIYGRN